MKRRDFLTGAGSAAAAGGVAAPAIAQGVRHLKMVTSWPKNYPGLGTAAELLAQFAREASGGKIDIKVYAAGELVPAFEVFDAVSNGTADMYHSAEYYWQGKAKAFSFFTAVPFGLTAAEMNAWVYHGGGQELWDELSARFNLKSLMCGNTGVQMGSWFRHEINTLDDLKGLRMRIPGPGGEVFRRVGVTTQAIPGGEIYQALQTGVVDAAEWVGPWNDIAFGFYKIAKYYYYMGFHEPGSALSLGINKDVWEDFSENEKELLRTAAAAVNDIILAEYNLRNGASLDVLVKEHSVNVLPYSDEILTKLGEISGQVVAEIGAENDLSRRIYESFLEVRRDSMEWFRIGDEAFWEARQLPFDYD